MKVKIFMSSGGSAQERNLLLSFGHGIRKCLAASDGLSGAKDTSARIGRWRKQEQPANYVELVYDDGYSECDVAVIFGSWKPRDKGTHVTRASVALNAKRFLVIETPLLNRRTAETNDHWRIGVNGFLNDAAHWPTMAAGAADQRLVDLGVEWTGWRGQESGHIVVALQLPGDASLRGIDVNEWAYETVTGLRQHTDRVIVIRSHPLAAHRAWSDHESLAARLAHRSIQNLVFSDGYLVPWHYDLNGAYCTVTYTSGLAVDSVVCGVPTIACDPGNFAWSVSSNFVDEVNDLRRPNDAVMMDWLRQLATCQWSVSEMRDGTAWQALLPVLEQTQ